MWAWNKSRAHLVETALWDLLNQVSAPGLNKYRSKPKVPFMYFSDPQLRWFAGHEGMQQRLCLSARRWGLPNWSRSAEQHLEQMVHLQDTTQPSAGMLPEILYVVEQLWYVALEPFPWQRQSSPVRTALGCPHVCPGCRVLPHRRPSFHICTWRQIPNCSRTEVY